MLGVWAVGSKAEPFEIYYTTNSLYQGVVSSKAEPFDIYMANSLYMGAVGGKAETLDIYVASSLDNHCQVFVSSSCFGDQLAATNGWQPIYVK